VRHTANIHLENLPGMAELLMQLKNALCDFLGGACEYHLAALEISRPAWRRLRRTPDFRRAGLEHADFVFQIGGLGYSAIFADKAAPPEMQQPH
jgi:hypothetical protein